ncbi:hypothetical protein NDU88_000494 [Pleurodeles waltl]|uniref:Uncharacterized protein n=1 Tax=Pleurodeles waltl TaxID=8319 RepID=A0AAV7MH12_PLEWA|nr:hypothetical protein NDU88_000494 [Pleurodeles waltl]
MEVKRVDSTFKGLGQPIPKIPGRVDKTRAASGRFLILGLDTDLDVANCSDLSGAYHPHCFPKCSSHLPRSAPCARPRSAQRARHSASKGALVTFHAALHVPGTALPKVLWSPSTQRSTCQAQRFQRCSSHLPRSAPCARHSASQGALVTFHAALHVPGHATLHVPDTLLPKVLWSPSTLRYTCRAQRIPMCSGHLPRSAPRAGHTAYQGALVTFHAALHVSGTALPKVLWSPSTQCSTCRAQHFPRCSGHLPRSAPCAGHSTSQGALVTFHAALHVPGHAALHVPGTALPKVLWSPSTLRYTCRAQRFPRCSGHLPRSVPRAAHCASQGALVTFHAVLHVPGTALPKVLWSPSTQRSMCQATQRSTCRAQRFPRCSGHLPRSAPRAGHSASQCVLVTFHAALHVPGTLLPKVLWSPSMTRSTCQAHCFPRCSGHHPCSAPCARPRSAPCAGHIASQGALVTFHAVLHVPGSALPKVL